MEIKKNEIVKKNLELQTLKYLVVHFLHFLFCKISDANYFCASTTKLCSTTLKYLHTWDCYTTIGNN